MSAWFNVPNCDRLIMVIFRYSRFTKGQIKGLSHLSLVLNFSLYVVVCNLNSSVCSGPLGHNIEPIQYPHREFKFYGIKEKLKTI